MRESEHPYDQVWPAALRFLRLDERCKIVERDGEAGYILFELTDRKKVFTGAMELVRVKDDKGRAFTKLIVNIPDRPVYSEEGLLSRLEQKLRDEIGPPPRPKTAGESRENRAAP
ncbi:MAG: hypothetical protein HY698_01050 [Deltaproteobacteria bacterium]|nr:hypothetical protein [Deltaproteobacteria bacterium]